MHAWFRKSFPRIFYAGIARFHPRQAVTTPTFRYTVGPGRGTQVAKGEVCKTFIRGFDSHPRLHFVSDIQKLWSGVAGAGRRDIIFAVFIFVGEGEIGIVNDTNGFQRAAGRRCRNRHDARQIF